MFVCRRPKCEFDNLKNHPSCYVLGVRNSCLHGVAPAAECLAVSAEPHWPQVDGAVMAVGWLAIYWPGG